MTKKITEAQKRALACLTFSHTERLAMGADFKSPPTQVYYKLVKLGLVTEKAIGTERVYLITLLPTEEGKEIGRQYCHEFVALKG